MANKRNPETDTAGLYGSAASRIIKDCTAHGQQAALARALGLTIDGLRSKLYRGSLAAGEFLLACKYLGIDCPNSQEIEAYLGK